jgi:MoxR-like ATPase
MEERQVSVEGESHPLPDPFLVVATQNPVEYEGTYPLPEAELDRFLFKLKVSYPEVEAERTILQMHHEGRVPQNLDAIGVRPVASGPQLAAASAAAQQVTVEPNVIAYVVDLAWQTRNSPSLTLGVSPRGAAMLLTAAKAWAYLSGRDFVTPDDVKSLVKPAWRHRMLLRPEVELEGVSADAILDSLVERVTVPS